jgi:cytosine/uracil/thiamine/allantoin permease
MSAGGSATRVPGGAAGGPVGAPAGEDLSHSPLWNPDLAPTAPERRTLSTYTISALWI